MIHVSGVTKRLGNRPVIRDLSFVAVDGSINGLVGPNGAGKTTTLRLITGVLPPDSGHIRMDEVDPGVDFERARGAMGALLDHTGLYGRLTSRETLSYFGQLRGLRRAALQARVNAVVDQLAIAHIADRRTAGLSQGELLKVGLGCAILHQPKHILLDEPTNGLDPNAIIELRQTLKSLRDAGSCVIFSSHVLSEVQALCDRIVVITNGTIATQGTVEEVCAAAGATALEDAFLHLTRPPTSYTN
jgi:sodium transport system ATP-binding protein